MAAHTVEEFVNLVGSLSPGDEIAYHQGYIPSERNSTMMRIKFDRLRAFINLCYDFDIIEVFTRKVQELEYRYYVRLRREWPHEVMLSIAKEFDEKRKLEGWFLKAKASQVESALTKI